MILSIKRILHSKKLIFSLILQFTTLFVSILMTVGVTKFISVENYGYWQLFIFYAGYVGVAHFGICDGLYLIYGGKKIEEIDKNQLKGVYVVFFLIQITVALIIFVYASLFDLEFIRQKIFYDISILLIISNSQIFLGYILLATNKIVEYSKAILLEKILLILLILSSIFLKMISVEVLIFSYIISKLISLIYLSRFYTSFFFQKAAVTSSYIIFLIKEGGYLMISNIVSALILGVGRYFIDKNWNIEVFGKISLAISLVYFVLVLLAQVSFLLFPYLRNSSDENQKNILQKLNKGISLILKICIICYFPFTYILQYFLPNYHESIHYLILLLPICLYDGKMQIIYSTYFKNLFLQKQLLFINIICFSISLIIALIGSYLYQSLNVILMGIVVSIILRSIISELIITKKYKIQDFYAMVMNFLFSLIIIIYFFINFSIYILIPLLLLVVILNLNLKSIFSK